MLMALLPLFDDKLAVRAYSIFTQKNNFLLNPMLLGTGLFDGASRIEGLEMIESMGPDSLPADKEIFIPVNNISLFFEMEKQCDTNMRKRIVLLLDNSVKPEEMYLERMQMLKAMGFRMAIRKLLVADFTTYDPVLKLVDFIFINSHKVALDKAKFYFGRMYPNIQICAGNIDNMETFEALSSEGGYALFEGKFYQVPITHGQNEVTPIKTNYIELLNVVNGEDFELTKAADIIGRDTALTISLLEMVNRSARNSEITSIRHAASMLGQRELKKWINAAAANLLYSDKPNEITRLSLLRARFAENLAAAFQLTPRVEELFLMGLFSVLDVILEKSMEEALQVVRVSKAIQEALIYHKGEFAELYDFMCQYENANWSEVSRQMIIQNIDMETATNAYLDSIRWCREIMSEH